MNYKKCIYFVEEECEKQLIDALKQVPPRMLPGKVFVHNVIQNEIPRHEVNKIQPRTTVVFCFDTDKEKTDVLKKNIERVKEYTSKVELVNLVQVLRLEDELVRATDVRKAQELTKSTSVRDFKNDFCRMKTAECRNALERHHVDVAKLWVTKAPDQFVFLKRDCAKVKL